MAIYKCKECPYFEKRDTGHLFAGVYYFCNKFNTRVDYNKGACSFVKGKSEDKIKR